MPELQPEKWIARYTDFLSDYAKHRVPKSLVEDLVQETFYSGLKSARNFKGDAHERTWLTSILRYKIIDYYRRSNSLKAYVNEKLIMETDYNYLSINKLNNLKLDENNEETNFALKELECLVEKGIKVLTELERHVFELRLQGHTTHEICNHLNIKENYCWVLMSKARKKMRNYLSNNWIDAA
ncbi:MAG: RNA polymerase sigma factor [Bacteroidota bacterium]